MKISKAFPSDFLKAADLDDTPRTVKIKSIEFNVKIGDDEKPVIYFSGEAKALVLNKTNSNIISKMFGEETDDWIGKEIIIYPAMVEFKGDMVEAIRIRIPKSPAPRASKAAEPEYDDEGYPVR